MFEGDQLILLGQYIGDEPVTFNLSGNYLGRERTFAFNFDFDNATTRNSFVPRLWANSKIAELIDAIRQFGADNAVAANDPRIKELVDDIIRLSTEFGILTEYTAFLAEEGSDLSNAPALQEMATSNFRIRAMNTRTGMGGVNQMRNSAIQKSGKLNISNQFFDMNMQRVSIANVQQINDRAFFQRGNRWVDSRIISNEADAKPDRVIRIGSDEFLKLAERLSEEGRAGSLSMKGEIMLQVDGEKILAR